MALVHDFNIAARWGLRMALIGPESAINELPPTWRKAAYAALMAISLTAGYFMFVAGPMADAQQAVKDVAKRVDKVEGDISQIKGDISEIKSESASRDQKIDDMKDTMAQINQKLDRIIERATNSSRSPNQYPP